MTGVPPAEPVRLSGSLVRLREFTPGDHEAAHGIVGDPRVTDFLSFDAKTREQTRQMIDGILDRARSRPRTEYYLAVTLPGAPPRDPRVGSGAAAPAGAMPMERLVGFARLGLSGVRAAELGYAIHADHWGRGYATDAAATLITYGFATLGLHRISAAIGPANAASIALSARLGFQYEGRLRDHVYTNGAWRDSVLYSLLTHEWNPQTAT